MKHKEKLQWMANFAMKNKSAITLEGECGIGRECVGLLANGTYPDYEWFDEEFKRIDENGEVWLPEDAYHKHPCVAVLGRGEKAEAQLYEWLKWFDDNGFEVEITINKNKLDSIELMMGRSEIKRMVKKV